MRIIFMGNGPFAEPALRRLAESDHEIRLVVARPDRPQGKKKRIEPGPIKRAADELGLEVVQPESVNDPQFWPLLRQHGPDILVVADFGQILSSDCLATTRLGGINIHGSLLPKYRGAAPIVWAVNDGETETGVTIIQMTPKMDAGGIILQESIPIGPNETTGDVEPRLAELGGKLCLQALELIGGGQAKPLPQSDQEATRAPKVKKEHGQIDWTKSAEQIRNQVRAMQPWPIAYTFWHGVEPPLRLQILAGERLPHETGFAQPGEIVSAEDDGIHVQTGEGILGITRVKPAGKSAMTAEEFLRGRPLRPGERFA